MSRLGKFFIKMENSVLLKNKSKRPFIVTVEGNIGSGKTTFLDYFNKFRNVCVLSEPIELWRNCQGHNLLGHMYKNPKQWSFSFQSYVQLTMLQHHMQETQHPVKLMERSIYSARYCFVEKMSKDGLLTSTSVSVIDEWFKWIKETKNAPVDLIIYLRTTPEIVYERMIKRNRTEEKSVSLQYLVDLHEMHEEWLYYKTKHHCPAPVLTINGDMDKALIINEYEKCRPNILNNVIIS